MVQTSLRSESMKDPFQTQDFSKQRDAALPVAADKS